MLSVCIITKNEREKLNRCMVSLKEYVVELVVVDTGSSDGTQEMLERWQQSDEAQFTIKTGSFVWCDDFSAAKNYAISLASYNEVFVLDSDEVVEEMNLTAVERFLTDGIEKIGRIVRRNQMEQNGQINYQQEYISRIFDRRRYRYAGKIHEQLESMDGELASDAYVILPVVLWHDGYMGTPEQKREKAKRNILLLKQELETGGDDPYILYQLGKSCYMQGDYAKAAEYFSRGLTFDLNPSLEYVIDMVETYGYALLNDGRASEALMFENIYEEFGAAADFKLLMGLIYMNNEMFDAAVAEFLDAAKCKSARMQGANSFLAYYNAGVIFECLGSIEQARQYYKMCGDYAPAKARIESLGR